MRTWTPLTLTLTLATMPSAAQETAAMDALMARHFRADQPGAVVLVQKGGKVLFHKAYGMSDLAAKQPLATPQVFRVASVTKTFTAAAILALVEDGKVDLKASVRRYVKDLPAAWEAAQVEHLLSNTSGIPSYTDDPAWWERQHEALTPAYLLDTYAKAKPLVFAPGSQWQYSNSGFVLLGMIIEAVTGKTYEAFLKERFWGPLGMTATRYGWDEPPIQGLAQGYAPGPTPAPFVNKVQLFSTAGLVSTTQDLARWLQGLSSGKVLKPETFARMTKPFATRDGQAQGYGFGLFLRESQGHRLAGHGGQILGYNAMVEMDLVSGAQAIILTNLYPQPVPLEYLTRRLLGLANQQPVEEPRPILLPPERLARLTGVYQTERGPLKVAWTEGRLWRIQGPQRLELLPLSETRFGHPNSDTEVIFQLEGATVLGLRVAPLGAPMTPLAKRIGEYAEPKVVALDPAVLEGYAGTFALEPGMSFRFWKEGDRLLTQAPGEPVGELLPIGPDTFLLKGPGVRVLFQRDAAGQDSAVRIQPEGRSALEAKRVK